jgi:hypothetical protein
VKGETRETALQPTLLPTRVIIVVIIIIIVIASVGIGIPGVIADILAIRVTAIVAIVAAAAIRQRCHKGKATTSAPSISGGDSRRLTTPNPCARHRRST